MKLVHYIPYGKQYNRYSIVNAPYTQELLQKCPEYAYHSNIFEFIYELISDTDRDVETSIILGAVAAQKITDYINKEKYTEIPDLLTALKSELRSASIIESIDKIKPVPEIRIGVQARIFDAVTDSTYMTDKVKSGMLNISVFEKGFANYQKVFSGRTFAYRNLVLNTLIDIGFPFACQKYSVFEYYCYFTAVVSFVKLISALIFKDSTEYEHEYKLAIAKLYRKMAHNLSSAPKTMKILKEYNCKSPAYLAVIIK